MWIRILIECSFAYSHLSAWEWAASRPESSLDAVRLVRRHYFFQLKSLYGDKFYCPDTSRTQWSSAGLWWDGGTEPDQGLTEENQTQVSCSPPLPPTRFRPFKHPISRIKPTRPSRLNSWRTSVHQRLLRWSWTHGNKGQVIFTSRPSVVPWVHKQVRSETVGSRGFESVMDKDLHAGCSNMMLIMRKTTRASHLLSSQCLGQGAFKGWKLEKETMVMKRTTIVCSAFSWWRTCLNDKQEETFCYWKAADFELLHNLKWKMIVIEEEGRQKI